MRMRVKRPVIVKLSLFVLWCGLSFFSVNAQNLEEKLLHRAAEKLDEYGRVGHCDLTARLDNFAITLQNDPTLKGLIVGYHPDEGREGYVDKHLKIAHYYLTKQRGIDPALIIVVNGGRDIVAKEARTELWVVPEGAPIPVYVPATIGNVEFTGKLNFYHTEEAAYREIVEMGFSDTAMAHEEFAGKLKAQPDSLGYLVIRTPPNALPGAWRRIARRDEKILEKDFEIEPGRLKSIDGGQTEGEQAIVELWILAKDEPPPPGITEKLERIMKEPFELNGFGMNGAPEEDEINWAVENLAEFLRRDKQAHACIIIRPYQQPEDETPESDEIKTEDMAASASDAASLDATENKTSDEVFEPQALAGKLKRKLAEKFGIDEQRIHVMTGNPIPWGMNGTLSLWVVPKGAALPDPFIVTKDEETSVEDDLTVPAPESRAAAPPGALHR